jgi:hypothetical protein
VKTSNDHKNLKPFKKGQSGNPNGRPKMPNLKEACAAVLADEKDGMTALDAVLKALRNKAIKGDVRAAQELMDRAYGKATQAIDLNAHLSAKTLVMIVTDKDIDDPPDE